MQDTFFTTEKTVAAIIFCKPADPVSGKTALKYRNVDNSTVSTMNKFLDFARKFPTAQYVNFYSRKSGVYVGRLYL